MLEELFYFADNKLSDASIDEMLQQQSLVLLLKRTADNLPSIDDVICQMVYGNRRQPPGDDERTPYQQLLTIKDNVELVGLWTPLNPLTKAICLKLFFPNLSTPYLLPSTIEPIRLHIIVAYDAFKYRNVMELSSQYPGHVINYGFFSSDIPGEAKLIAKTIDKFENRPEPPTYEEKFVIQLAKTEYVDVFLDLGPSYRSKDAVVGEDECKLFFPVNYNQPDRQIGEIKKKKRKSKTKLSIQNDHQSQMIENQENIAEYVCGIENEMGDLEETVVESEVIVEGGGEEEEEEDDEDDEDEDGEEVVDKATSPMCGKTDDNQEEN